MVVVLSVAGLGIGWVPVALAQGADVRPLLERMERLERDVRALHRQVARGGSGEVMPLESVDEGNPAVTRLDVRLSALEDELRGVTGQMEDVSYRLSRLNERLDKLVADVDFRLSRLEGGAPAPSDAGATSGDTQGAIGRGSAGQSTFSDAARGTATAPRPPAATGSGPRVLGRIPRSDLETLPNVPPAPQASQTPALPPVGSQATASTSTVAAPAGGVLPEGTVRQQYDHAFGLMQRASWPEAEQALRAFIDRHPDEDLTSNARYWLGETYYVRGDHTQAAEAFLNAYRLDRDGPKAADSLLKLSMSLGNLGKNREACATLDELRRAKGKASASILDRANAERERLGCT